MNNNKPKTQNKNQKIKPMNGLEYLLYLSESKYTNKVLSNIAESLEKYLKDNKTNLMNITVIINKSFVWNKADKRTDKEKTALLFHYNPGTESYAYPSQCTWIYKNN